ncbi:MAG: GGDEF domain-containing protein [Candidatus Dojkabacteria bacterium]
MNQENISSLLTHFIEIVIFHIDENGNIKKVVLNTKENFSPKVKNIYDLFNKEDRERVEELISLGIDGEKEYLELKKSFNTKGHIKAFLRAIEGKLYLGLKFSKSAKEKELQKEKRLEELNIIANTDPMTKLLNRNGYWERVKLLLNCKDPERKIGILVIDLDKLKYINDTFGHKAGDKAITDVGRLISSSIRSRDIGVRYGGDEFVVVVEELSGSQSTAYGLAERLLKQVRLSNTKHLTTISVGVHVVKICGFDKYLNDEKELERRWEGAFEKADKMLYKAKSSGGNRVVASFEV